MLRRFVLNIVMAAGLALTATSAHAVYTISSCSSGLATCSANCQLGQDITCASNESVILNNGADLDLKGHSISCASGSVCTRGIMMNASSSSVVKDTVTGGRILGAFTTVIECNP